MIRCCILAIPVLLVVSATSAGCAAKKKAALPGAVYAQAVSVYQPATYDGAMGGSSGSDFDVATSESVSWFFKTDDPMDKVVAFYDQALTGATKETEDGEVRYTFVPPGCEEGEEVQVIVGAGTIQIHESTKPGKHTDPSCYDKAMEETGLGWLK